ncbi:peptidase M16 [Endomicrobiia bacterium]|nr:peptidase M16 [Endomicrobiia bacterium]
MQYFSLDLASGLRIVHLSSNSPVSYCGFAVNAGTRDENSDEFGLAHFVEHTLFKGTQKRKPWHILNRMESVGGELDAYTNKEETFLYTVCLSEDVERAIELLSDLVFHSQFPDTELDKEREVVIDEINSYRDTPSELIYDEFENLIFSNHELGHNILGEPESLETFGQDTCRSFVNRFYHPANMVFFSLGKTPFNKIVRLANKYLLQEGTNPGVSTQRTAPFYIPPRHIEKKSDLHQTHIIVGGRAFSIYDSKRLGLLLLNNILGGPGMNSRLNINMREKNGLVYTVESGLTSFVDSGIFTIYFGCDHQSKNKCLDITYKELKRIRNEKLTHSQFTAAVKQWKGQLGIANEQNENIALGMAKSFLHFNKYENLSQIYQRIDALTADFLLEIANEVYDENHLFSMTFR